MMKRMRLGGSFTLPGTSMTLNRMGYGAMQLAGPDVWGPPRDVDGAIAVLREAVTVGVNHIDTSDYYGPHVTNLPSIVPGAVALGIRSKNPGRYLQPTGRRVPIW